MHKSDQKDVKGDAADFVLLTEFAWVTLGNTADKRFPNHDQAEYRRVHVALT